MILTVVLILQPQVPRATGIFELEIKLVRNLKGELQPAVCCDGGREHHDSHCIPVECDTYFRLCLKEYQVRVLPGGPCILGTGSSTVLGGNSFSLADKRNDNGIASRVEIPFHFAWPRSYSLILEAWVADNDSGSQRLIERITHSGMVNPGDQWQHRRHHGRTAHIDYNIRVRCDENYYGVSCNKLCRPRDDFFGHYTCDPMGNKVCVEGWIGTQCTQAVCKQGCHGTRGYCEEPGQCKCQYGWQGLLCNACILFPGCIHGTCSEPWKCDCETNWGGLLCDKDLNYCGTHQPCQNGGTCENTEPNEYKCICAEGFGGPDCDTGNTFHLILVLLVVMVILIVSVCIYLFMKRRRRKERERLPPSERVNNQRVTLNLIQNLPKPDLDGDPEYGYKTLCAAKESVRMAEHLGTDRNLGLILPDVHKDVGALKGNGAISKLLNLEKTHTTNREREKLNQLDEGDVLRH
uniref:protein jagged-1-like n=1 Tax=Pristiophorus japonicus TaxID=55135 RepID=UPI00398ED02F